MSARVGGREQLSVRDVAVLGGGVIGLACAFELARRGRNVVIIERDRPGQQASQVAAGLLGTAALPLGEQDDIYPLKLDSLRRFPQFIADVESASGMNAGYRSEGTLWIARNADEDEQLDQLHAERAGRDLDSRRLSASAVASLEPNLSAELLSGLLVTDDVQVDPRRLLPELEQASIDAGVSVLSRHEARGAEYDESSDTWTVQVTRSNDSGSASPPDSVRARQLLITAGPWADLITDCDQRESTSLVSTGVGPVKGQLLRLHAPRLIDHVIRSTNIDLAQRDHGELIVASTKEPDAGWDLTPTRAAQRFLLERAYGVIPALRGLDVAEQSVGLRPAVDDHLPVIGSGGRRGLWIATGHYRHGILLAPATAHWLAEAMISEYLPEAIAAYGLERLGRSQLNEELVS